MFCRVLRLARHHRVSFALSNPQVPYSPGPAFFLAIAIKGLVRQSLSLFKREIVMMKMTVLVLATLFLVGCGGGTMPFAPPHNAGDVADGKKPANSSPTSHAVTGPSSFTFGGYTWQTHAWNAPPVGNKNGNVGTFVKSNVSIGSEL